MLKGNVTLFFILEGMLFTPLAASFPSWIESASPKAIWYHLIIVRVAFTFSMQFD